MLGILGDFPVRYAVVGAIISYITTFFGIAIFKTVSIPIVIGAAGLTGFALLYWFVKSENRIPDKAELNKIHYIYTAFMAVGWMGIPLIAGNYTGVGLMTMLVYTVAYGGFMSMVFKQKHIEGLILKRNS